MKREAVYGVGTGINGREAAMRATQRALDQLGAARPVLALVFVAQEFNAAEALAGLTSLLGETPLWGFSTTRPLCQEGDRPRAVVVALLTGPENKADVQWFPGYTRDSAGVARKLAQNLRSDIFLPQGILLAADGINGSLAPLCAALEDFQVNVAGGMAAGDPALGRTVQIGKNQAGPGGLSAVLLGGRFRLGVGLAHGWQDLGVYCRATRTRDVWLQTLDDAPAAEIYARFFGYSAREWAFPPLTDLARLYPLGVEPRPAAGIAPLQAVDPRELLVRSALRVEVDGSLRMSAPVPEGSLVHLMTGDPDACVRAAQEAARQALDGLGGARPLLAVALVDAAWHLLFEARPDGVAAALNAALGGLPLVGAYTYGQLARPALDRPPVLHNQNLALIILGEAEE